MAGICRLECHNCFKIKLLCYRVGVVDGGISLSFSFIYFCLAAPAAIQCIHTTSNIYLNWCRLKSDYFSVWVCSLVCQVWLLSHSNNITVCLSRLWFNLSLFLIFHPQSHCLHKIRMSFITSLSFSIFLLSLSLISSRLIFSCSRRRRSRFPDTSNSNSGSKQDADGVSRYAFSLLFFDHFVKPL